MSFALLWCVFLCSWFTKDRAFGDLVVLVRSSCFQKSCDPSLDTALSVLISARDLP